MVNKIINFLDIKEQKLKNSHFLLLIIFSYIFSILIRYIWINWASGVSGFFWNNELMINTNDGYYWAEGARDILAGSHQVHDLSPVDYPLSRLTALLVQILPVKFETIILWMPSVFGSLIVVPVMLIGRAIKCDFVGFFAALVSAIAWSYYNRTMSGYYDTDMLIVVLPTFVVWGTIYALKSGKIEYILYAPIFAILSLYWHNGTINIVNAVFFITISYAMIFERKNLYYYKFLSIFVIALTTLPIMIKILSAIFLFLIYKVLNEKINEKIIFIITLISVIVYLLFGGIEWISNILHNAYVTRLLIADNLQKIDMQNLKFYGVVNTVREAGHIPFRVFADRISGSVVGFWLGSVGYVLLLIRYRVMLFSLPMVILGFFALQGGLRFTVFAVPFMALGVSYLLFLFFRLIENLFSKNKRKIAKYIFVGFGIILVLYPNINHVLHYKVPTVFSKPEVKVLAELKNIASREDYVLSWWDYGYPIRYYSDVKTLIDGGKHSGDVNFPVSFALTHDQISAANIARLDVEFTEVGYEKECGDPIRCMLKNYKTKDPNTFLNALKNKNFKLPKKTRDVYIYLPNRMMGILPTVDLFSNMDITTGSQFQRPFFYMSQRYREHNRTVLLGSGIKINLQKGLITIGSQTIPLHSFIITAYDNQGKLHKKIEKIDSSSQISVIFMKNYRQFLVLDQRLLNSMYIQLFVLENYDKELYAPVILTPLAKVYKLIR